MKRVYEGERKGGMCVLPKASEIDLVLIGLHTSSSAEEVVASVDVGSRSVSDTTHPAFSAIVKPLL